MSKVIPICAVACLLTGSLAMADTPYYGTCTVAIQASENWTDTGIDLTAGDKCIVYVKGAAAGSSIVQGVPQFYGPDGVGDNCTDSNKPHQSAFMSILGRIGQSGPIFAVGTFRGISADLSGRLYLGVNDGFTEDNSGSYWAVIYQVPCPSSAVIGAPRTPEVSLSVYPNPSTGVARIALAAPPERTVNLSIVDVQGRQIRTLPSLQGSHSYQLTWDGRTDLGDAAVNGVYFVSAVSDRGTEWSSRIVVQR